MWFYATNGAKGIATRNKDATIGAPGIAKDEMVHV